MRRGSGMALVGAALALLLGVCVRLAAANVMGIDLGSEFMKVSLVKPGSMMDIVTNIHSKRKTETMVSFYQGERSYGADAYSLLTRKPEVTYARVPTLLGRHEEHPAVALLEGAYFPTKVGYNETRGGLAIEHSAPATDEMPPAFTPEELVAMILSHAKDITKAYGGVPVRDAVLVVPAFYTQPERQALMDAADIADIKVLGLMDENTAAALLFSVDNVYEEPTNIIFYNLGATSLQVSLVEMSSYTTGSGKNEKRVAQFTVKAKAWDETLGGFQFDLRLAELLADRFNDKWGKSSKGKGKDVRAFHKAMAKIRAQAKKVKEVLSANSNIPVHIEGVHDDIDLSTQVSRAELESLCEDLLMRAVKPLDAVLEQAGITLDQVAAVEVVGGGVRVPKVQSVLKERLAKGKNKLELSMHLNGDEAMAQGAAFYAANISTRFKVRAIGVTDILPFGIGARIDEAAPEGSGGKGLFGKLGMGGGGSSKEGADGKAAAGAGKWGKRATIFGPGHKLKANRTISFNTSHDLALNLTYEASPLFPQGAQPTIALYDIRGVEALAKEHGAKSAYPPKVFLTFELDASGMVHLVRAEARITEDPKDGPAPTPQPESGSEQAEVGDGDKAEEEDAAAEAEAAAAAAAEAKAKANKTADANNNATDAEAAAAAAAKAAEAAKPKAPQPVVHRATLMVKAHYEGLRLRPHSAVETAASAAKLAALRARDELRREKADARNSLEGYLYDVRNKLADQEEAAAQVSTEEQRAAVLAAVEAADEWMYDEGRDVAAAVYKAKTAEVKALAEPVFLRIKEGPGGLRAAAVEAGRKNVAEVRALAKKWNVTMPWLSEEDKAPLLEEAARVEAWLDEKEAAQAKLPGHEAAAFLSTEVDPQLVKMKDTARRLARKPAPPPPPPKPKANKTADANATGNGTDAEGAAGNGTAFTVKVEKEGGEGGGEGAAAAAAGADGAETGAEAPTDEL